MPVDPSPKDHDQDAGAFVEAFLKLTLLPVVGELGEKLKPATGGTTITVRVLVALLEPRALPATRVTVYVPALL